MAVTKGTPFQHSPSPSFQSLPVERGLGTSPITDNLCEAKRHDQIYAVKLFTSETDRVHVDPGSFDPV